MKIYKMVFAVLVCLPVLSALAGQWTYDSGSATLSHDTSGWILTASCNDTNLTVTGVSQSPGTPSALPLSDQTPGYTLVSIGNYAFSECDGLTNLVIGSGVTSIGNYAFYNCTGLVSVVIGSGVISIGSSAFRSCNGLTSVEIPDSVISIYNYAFEDCTGLVSVVIGIGVTSINNNAFPGCSRIRNVTLNADLSSFRASSVFPLSYHSLTNLVIGSGVTSIGDYAFHNCTGLTSVEIPDSVTSIDRYAFYNCTGLVSVVIGSGVTSIGDYAFHNCTRLTFVTIRCDGQVDSSSYNMFRGCVNISALVLDMPNVSTWVGAVSGYSTNGVSVIFGDSVTNINNDVFSNRDELTNIVFGAGTVEIGDGVFDDCNELKNIDFGTGTVNFNGYRTFADCDELKNIDFGSGSVNFNDYGFVNCDGLTNLVFGSGVINIGDYAFAECPGLTSVTIPRDVTGIGEAPFTACSSLTNISVAAENPVCQDIDGVLYSKDNSVLLSFPAGRSGSYAVHDGTALLGQDAFDDAVLASLYLPASVTNIGATIRFDCCIVAGQYVPVSDSTVSFNMPSITNISVAVDNLVYRDIGGVLCSKDGMTLLSYPTGRAGDYAIPSGVFSIGNWAFSECAFLTGVTFSESVTNIGNSAFHMCTNLTNIAFGSGTVDIGNGALAKCESLTVVVFPDSVANISDTAFCGCANLTDIAFGSGVTNIGYGAFYNCPGLTSVTLPGGVTHVRDYAFSGSSRGSMTNAVMSNVCMMGSRTFQNQFLTEVVFTGAEPPLIVEDRRGWSGEDYYSYCVNVAVAWEFYDDFMVLVPATYLNNWVDSVYNPIWRGRPVRTLESVWGIWGTFNFAVDDQWGLEWTTTGWFAQSGVRYSGSMAIQNGEINNGQISSVQTIVKNAGTLTFHYRVSSEEDYDFLNVYLDDALVLQDSGEQAEWREAQIVVYGTGKHKIRWDYVKDDSYSDGADCAWIDAVIWESGTAGTEMPVPYAWLDGFGLAEGIDYEVAAFTDTDGDGYPAWEEYVAGTDPTDDASVLMALISMQEGVLSVTWTPDLGSARVYTVEGKASLTENWQSPANATHRFFRVKVSMDIP